MNSEIGMSPGSQKPLAGSQIAGSQKLEARSWKPEAGSQKSESTSQEPATRAGSQVQISIDGYLHK